MSIYSQQMNLAIATVGDEIEYIAISTYEGTWLQ